MVTSCSRPDSSVVDIVDGTSNVPAPLEHTTPNTRCTALRFTEPYRSPQLTVDAVDRKTGRNYRCRSARHVVIE